MLREINVAMLLIATGLLAHPARAVDLSTRYAATLDSSKQTRGYQWTCQAQDVWRLKKFSYALDNKFRVDLGPSQVTFGCHGTNVLWAAVFPNDPGRLSLASHGQGEQITSVWLRFHPKRVGELFPADTVSEQGDAANIRQAQRLAAHKLRSSWHAGGLPMVPPPEWITIDAETREGSRRFFSINTTKRSADYIDAFRSRALPVPKSLGRDITLQVFDKVWNAFDREYAMFVVKPLVDWSKLRQIYRHQAAEAKDNTELASMLAEMLAKLQDLHVYVQVDGTHVPGYTRVRPLNGNPRAAIHLIGTIKQVGRQLIWARTDDAIGYINIAGLTEKQLPESFKDILHQMQDTRGLIIDLRFNGGGSELLGRKIAGHFLDKPRVYAMHQFRNGPQHTDLDPKHKRICETSDLWHYAGPVVVLQGQRTMSSAEALAMMFAACPQVVTMGDRTAGSSGNPRQVDAGAGIHVNLPRWIPLDAAGKSFDAIGIQPDVFIASSVKDFDDKRDPVLAAALKHLRRETRPAGQVLKLRPGALHPKQRPQRRQR